MSAKARLLSKPIRTVLAWQAVVTGALVLLAGALAGVHGALSAALGGAVSMGAGLSSAVVAAKRANCSAGGILLAALTAEGLKIGLMALLLWLVLATYDGVVVGVLVGAFIATAMIFTMAFLVRER
ncbi:MAG TPA: ATP synthase subunit I [Burkholderiales bacterium]|nr:ATP synthase subunit I [Burkholderiales bacterium]